MPEVVENGGGEATTEGSPPSPPINGETNTETGSQELIVDSLLGIPDLSEYPTGADLITYIKSLGILNPDTYEATFALIKPDLLARAAADQWEEYTGWNPYLPSYDPNEQAPIPVVSQMRRFDPPGVNRSGWARGGGRQLELRAGLLQLDLLQTNISALLNTNPAPLVRDIDFWLMDQREDYNCGTKGRAYEVIEFAVMQYGTRASIHVTGIWGKTRMLKANVWNVVLNFGAYLAYQQLALSISRGLFSFKDLNVEIRYASGRVSPLAAEAQKWRDDFYELIPAEARFVS